MTKFSITIIIAAASMLAAACGATTATSSDATQPATSAATIPIATTAATATLAASSLSVATTTTAAGESEAESVICDIGEVKLADRCISMKTRTVALPPATTSTTTTARPRPPKPECPAGEFGVWQHSEWRWSECRRPTAPKCYGDYPVLLWVGGEWNCYEECDDGEVSAVRDGRARCVWDEETCDSDYPELLIVGGEPGCYAACDDGWKTAIINDEAKCIQECDEGEMEAFAANGDRWCLGDCDEGLERAWHDGELWCVWDEKTCDDEYPELLTIDGEPGCYKPCEDGLTKEILDGKYYCFEPADCGDGLEHRAVAGLGRICVPSRQMEADFWETALDQAAVPAGMRHGKWIGGKAISYNHPVFFSSDEADYWEEELGLYGEGEWGVRDYWGMVLYGSHAQMLSDIAEGRADAHICYGHDCWSVSNCDERLCGLIGSTNSGISSSLAFLWAQTDGLYFVMFVAEENPVGLDAFNRIASREMNAASIGGGFGYRTDRASFKQKDGISYPVHYWTYTTSAEGFEITLTPYGRDNSTWVSAKDFG